jgi:hypothetical protein
LGRPMEFPVMSLRLFAATALFGLTFSSAAAAQGGPMSVGLSSDPANRSLHCAAAIYMEKYLIQEENLASPFDRSTLETAGVAWVEDAAQRAGEDPGGFIQGKVFAAVAESKLNADGPRQAQVKWCLARTPPG